jgi:hypothetical protein
MKRVQLKPKPKGEGPASKRPASRAGEPVVKVEENQPCFQIKASAVYVHFFNSAPYDVQNFLLSLDSLNWIWMFLGLLDLDPFVRGRDLDPSFIKLR